MITLERAQRGAELLQAAAGDSFRFHIYPGMGEWLGGRVSVWVPRGKST